MSFGGSLAQRGLPASAAAGAGLRGAKARISRLRGRRPTRGQALIALLVAIVLFATGWLLVRNSGLVAVEQVRVVGLSGHYDAAARRAVVSEAKLMTTMNVDESRLADAAGQYVDIAAIKTDSDFPHGLTIYVEVRRAVAVAKVGGATMAFGANGAVLEDARNLSALPTLEIDGGVTRGRVVDSNTREALTVLGAAPDVMLRRTESVKWGRGGLTLVLAKGLQLIFGNDKDAAAKWRAAAAVLAGDAAKGAKYVDLRVAGRPAVGGLGAAPVTVRPQPLVQIESPASGASGATGAAAAPAAGSTPATTVPPAVTPPATQQSPAAVGGAPPGSP